MSADIDKERAAFEAWALTDDGNCNAGDLRQYPVESFERATDGSVFRSPRTERDWIVWQAARATPSPAPIQQARQESCNAALSQPAHPDTDKLLAIIASAYQIAGAHDAPAHILDVLADPETATVEQVEAMLPYQPWAVTDERKE